MPDKEPTPVKAKLGKRQVIAALLIGLLLVWLSGPGQRDAGPDIGEKSTYSAVSELIAAGTVNQAWIDDGKSMLIVETSDKTHLHASYPIGAGGDVLTELTAKNLDVEVLPAKAPSLLPSLLLTLLPVVLILGFLAAFSKRGGMGGLSGMALGKTKSAPVDVPTTRFADVAGIDEAMADLAEVVDFLHNPERYQTTGATRPRGFLLVGPPGTGKTLLARAVAGEAGVPFYAITGSDFVELFAGLGASRVRSLFTKAREQEKAIVFIDEIDAIGKARGRGLLTGANDERENTLNALLVELDGFSRHDGIVILAATNRVDTLDPALLRPGRFDRTIVVPAPDRAGRRKIMELYSRGRPFDGDIDWETFARQTSGLTGAQIEQLLNEAALEAARSSSSTITSAHVTSALATTVLGRERRSAVISDRDRDIVAWHEAGHALVAQLTEHADKPLHVSIIPRGGTGGATWMNGSEHDLTTRTQAQARLAVAMGGRAAEEILLGGDHTQGAHGDLHMATMLATEMVARYGMGARLVSRDPERLGMDGHSAKEIDDEVDALLRDALNRARTLLEGNRDALQAIASALLESEHLDQDELQALVSEHPGDQALR